jgi:hypothetical protein
LRYAIPATAHFMEKIFIAFYCLAPVPLIAAELKMCSSYELPAHR